MATEFLANIAGCTLGIKMREEHQDACMKEMMIEKSAIAERLPGC